MSNNEIAKTLKELYELRSMRTELDDEISAQGRKGPNGRFLEMD